MSLRCFEIIGVAIFYQNVDSSKCKLLKIGPFAIYGDLQYRFSIKFWLDIIFIENICLLTSFIDITMGLLLINKVDVYNKVERVLLIVIYLHITHRIRIIFLNDLFYTGDVFFFLLISLNISFDEQPNNMFLISYLRFRQLFSYTVVNDCMYSNEQFSTNRDIYHCKSIELRRNVLVNNQLQHNKQYFSNVPRTCIRIRYFQYLQLQLT